MTQGSKLTDSPLMSDYNEFLITPFHDIQNRFQSQQDYYLLDTLALYVDI